MKVLVDTSILVALKGVDLTRATESQRALQALDAQGNSLFLCAQVMMEYWAVATRPASARGGLGLSIAQADADVQAFLNQFGWVDDGEQLFGTWQAIVRTYAVSGRQVWDARIAALMQVHSKPLKG
jgi:predicted nucleic acid-binding protein